MHNVVDRGILQAIKWEEVAGQVGYAWSTHLLTRLKTLCISRHSSQFYLNLQHHIIDDNVGLTQLSLQTVYILSRRCGRLSAIPAFSSDQQHYVCWKVHCMHAVTLIGTASGAADAMPSISICPTLDQRSIPSGAFEPSAARTERTCPLTAELAAFSNATSHGDQTERLLLGTCIYSYAYMLLEVLCAACGIYGDCPCLRFEM